MTNSSRTVISLAVASLLAAGSRAQLTAIVQAGPGETVQPVTSQLRGVAVTSDGRLWALTHYNDGKNQGPRSQFVRLHASSDNGKTWKLATTTRTEGAIRGSMVTGTDGRTLHVVFRATGGQVGAGIYYAPFDTRTDQWAAADLALIQGGSSTNQQYLEPHVSITRKGTLVVAFYQHRQGLWPSWSGGMMYHKSGKWSQPQRVNVDTFGVVIDAMTHGEDVWFAYRTNAGLYGVRARRFDTVTEKWGAEGELQVSQQNRSMAGTASSGNNVAVAPNGDVYVIYASGDSTAGKGAIWVGYKKAGTSSFATHAKVADDAPLRGGNFTYWHYSLSRAFDGRIHVLYSLSSESHQKLYMRWLVDGKVLPPVPITLATGVANQFAWVSGHRTALGGFGLKGTARDTSVTGGRAWYFGGQQEGVVVFHGQGCDGGNHAVPFLDTSNLPAVGGSVDLTLSDLPASRPGLVFFGLDDTKLGAIPLPLDLKIIQMPGCLLVQDFFLTLGYAADGQGNAGLKVPLLNDPVLNGLPLYFQAFQLAPGANGQNALLSNGIAAVSR